MTANRSQYMITADDAPILPSQRRLREIVRSQNPQMTSLQVQAEAARLQAHHHVTITQERQEMVIEPIQPPTLPPQQRQPFDIMARNEQLERAVEEFQRSLLLEQGPTIDEVDEPLEYADETPVLRQILPATATEIPVVSRQVEFPDEGREDDENSDVSEINRHAGSSRRQLTYEEVQQYLTERPSGFAVPPHQPTPPPCTPMPEDPFPETPFRTWMKNPKQQEELNMELKRRNNPLYKYMNLLQ